MIPEIDLKKRTIGLNFSEGGISDFAAWAPGAKSIELLINGSQRFVPEKDDYGYWRLSSQSIRQGDMYRIRIDDEDPVPDPASLYQQQGVMGPSVACNLSEFEWSDDGWTGMDQTGNIFYELHTGTFSPEGTFDGIAGRIDYLKELGITTVEIMPVSQFPGSRNWGYDGVFPFAVQNTYGGPAGLQRLVNSLHENGISVVLDVVYNHIGPEGNYLTRFGPYFTDKYKTPWGQAINYDDEWCDAVRRFFIENMLMWFRDFHIDGLRLDAVHAIRDFSPKHITRELREYADELEKITGRKYRLIAELDLNDTRFINPVETGGYGLDMQWCDEFHHAVHSYVTREKNGYYSDFGELHHVVKALNSAYVYDGIFSKHRKKTFGTSTSGIDGNKFIVFIQNHDHIGNRILGDRIGRIVDSELLKLIAGAMFISPYCPLIFMGEEYNETNPFQYFTSHGDKELQIQVKEGRAREFSAFMNAGEVPDPQSEGVFHTSILQYELTGKNKLIFEYYRKLIQLKKNHPVWKSHDRSNSIAVEAGEDVILYTRKLEGHEMIALLNFGNSAIEYRLDETRFSRFSVILDSSEKRWGGLVEDDLRISEGFLTAQPFSLIVVSDIS